MVTWAADIEVTVQTVLGLIDRQLPDLRRLPVARFAEGWDNVVFTIGRQWLIRLPRRRRAVDGVVREISALPFIAPILPIAIPVPVFVGSPDASYPWPFFVYRRLPGRESCDLELSEAARSDLAGPIAKLLRRLHGDDRLREYALGLPCDLRRLRTGERMDFGLERLSEVRRAGEILPFEKLRQILVMPIETHAQLVLVHGDLHFRHLLISNGAISGLIDWGKVHAGDPAVDLQIYWSLIPAGLRSAFLSEYGPIDDSQLRLARSVAVWLNLVLLQYAVAARLPFVAKEARKALYLTTIE